MRLIEHSRKESNIFNNSEQKIFRNRSLYLFSSDGHSSFIKLMISLGFSKQKSSND